MKNKNQMKLVFESRSVNEAFSRVAVAAFCTYLDPTAEEICDVKTAVSEAVTNCIVHAYDGIGAVILTAAIGDDNTLTVKVKDKGKGIEDVKKAMEPMFTTRSGEERAGLGFSVMQSFMDKVKVQSKPNKGTTVTLIKKLNARDS